MPNSESSKSGKPEVGIDSVPSDRWYLEGVLERGGKPARILLQPLPCRVGRRLGLPVALPFDSVSGVHAEFSRRGDALSLVDLGSTNGTYLNRVRIGAGSGDGTAVHDGDVVHFGEREFRVVRALAEDGMAATMDVDLRATNLPHELVTGVRDLDGLLEQGAVAAWLQPLVGMDDGVPIGWELLGRGAYPSLPVSPYELFRVAAAADKEAALSRVFRDVGVRQAQRAVGDRLLFVNTHPEELRDVDGMLRSLSTLHEAVPTVHLVLEVHEGAAVGPQPMRRLREGLAELGMGLAYDDFGAGQDRTAELLTVPPDYVKFDISIIRDIHGADEARRRRIASLVRLLKDQGVVCLAEGVETAEEADACREAGFDLAQGWFYGRPAPVDG